MRSCLECKLVCIKHDHLSHHFPPNFNAELTPVRSHIVHANAKITCQHHQRQLCYLSHRSTIYDCCACFCHYAALTSVAHFVFAGGGMMTKFVGVFRELATFTELLHTQVELILVERLHRNWLKAS